MWMILGKTADIYEGSDTIRTRKNIVLTIIYIAGL